MPGNNIFDKSELALRRAKKRLNAQKPPHAATILSYAGVIKPDYNTLDCGDKYEITRQEIQYYLASNESEYLYAICNRVINVYKTNQHPLTLEFMESINYDVNLISPRLLEKVKIGNYRRFDIFRESDLYFESSKIEIEARDFMRKYVFAVKCKLGDLYPDLDQSFTASMFIFPRPGIQLEFTRECFNILSILEYAERVMMWEHATKNARAVVKHYSKLSIEMYIDIKAYCKTLNADERLTLHSIILFWQKIECSL